jgi:hypothetical protein
VVLPIDCNDCAGSDPVTAHLYEWEKGHLSGPAPYGKC